MPPKSSIKGKSLKRSPVAAPKKSVPFVVRLPDPDGSDDEEAASAAAADEEMEDAGAVAAAVEKPKVERKKPKKHPAVTQYRLQAKALAHLERGEEMPLTFPTATAHDIVTRLLLTVLPPDDVPMMSLEVARRILYLAIDLLRTRILPKAFQAVVASRRSQYPDARAVQMASCRAHLPVSAIENAMRNWWEATDAPGMNTAALYEQLQKVPDVAAEEREQQARLKQQRRERHKARVSAYEKLCKEKHPTSDDKKKQATLRIQIAKYRLRALKETIGAKETAEKNAVRDADEVRDVKIPRFKAQLAEVRGEDKASIAFAESSYADAKKTNEKYTQLINDAKKEDKDLPAMRKTRDAARADMAKWKKRLELRKKIEADHEKTLADYEKEANQRLKDAQKKAEEIVALRKQATDAEKELKTALKAAIGVIDRPKEVHTDDDEEEAVAAEDDEDAMEED